MGEKAVVAEPAQHRWSGERGEVPQCLEAQTHEQVSETGKVTATRQTGRAAEARESEHSDGERGQELGALTFGHHQWLTDRRLSSGHTCGKEAISDPYFAAASPTVPAGLLGHDRLNCRCHSGHQCAVAANVPGSATSPESKLARLEHFGTWCEGLDRRHNRLPPACLGREVARQDLQTRATGLGFSPAHTGPGTSSPRRRRSSHHLVGRYDSHLAGGLSPCRYNGPIWAIGNQGPWLAHSSARDTDTGRHSGLLAGDQLELGYQAYPKLAVV